MNIRFILFAIAVLLGACESEPQATFGFQDEGMQKYVLKGLEQRGVWYRQEDEGQITMYEKDLPIAGKLGAEFGEQAIPVDRSIGVNSRAQPTIEEALKKAGVKYRVITFGAAALPPYSEEVGMSAEWIVFEPGHETKGFEIIDKINENFDFWAKPKANAANKFQRTPNTGVM